jgi:hypothetical protein
MSKATRSSNKSTAALLQVMPITLRHTVMLLCGVEDNFWAVS